MRVYARTTITTEYKFTCTLIVCLNYYQSQGVLEEKPIILNKCIKSGMEDKTRRGATSHIPHSYTMANFKYKKFERESNSLILI